MPQQTTIQNANAIFPFDGYKVEIGPNIGSLTNIGVCEGDAVAALQWAKFKQESANGPILFEQIKDLIINMDFNMYELDVDNLNIIGGGLFNLTTTAGTPVSGGVETIASGDWAYNQMYVLQNKESDGSQPTINSVTGSVDGALVLDTDYFVTKNQDGKWGIYILDTVTVTTLVQSIAVDTDYTPAASKTLDAGTNSLTLTPAVVRFSHIDGDSKERYLDIWAATLGENGFTFTFGSQVNDGAQSFPVSLSGDLDTTRDDGKQLMSYVDQQSVV